MITDVIAAAAITAKNTAHAIRFDFDILIYEKSYCMKNEKMLRIIYKLLKLQTDINKTRLPIIRYLCMPQ